MSRLKDMQDNKWKVLNIREQRLKENSCKCGKPLSQCDDNKVEESIAQKARKFLMNITSKHEEVDKRL